MLAGKNIRLFIISTGRSGSQSIAQMLNQHPEILCKHESYPELIRISTEFAHRIKSWETIKHELLQLFEISPINKVSIVGESDQKLGNLIPILNEIFPDCKFIWLLRKGTDVVASTFARGWFSEYEQHICDLQTQDIGYQWILHRLKGNLCGAMSATEWDCLSDFEKNCWYWTYWNTVIYDNLHLIDQNRWKLVKLEQIESSIDDILEFLHVEKMPLTVSYKNRAKQVPGWKHYHLPVYWSQWGNTRRTAFNKWCGDLMNQHYEEWERDSKAQCSTKESEVEDNLRFSPNTLMPQPKLLRMYQKIKQYRPFLFFKHWIKYWISSCFNTFGYELRKKYIDGAGYIDADETVKTAQTKGQCVRDYVETIWDQKGRTQQIVKEMKNAGSLIPCHRVCEIGPGTGRYLELIIQQVQPAQYDIYEIADDWAAWLERTYSPVVVRQPTDGHTLQHTPNECCGLVHAHGVFVCLPLVYAFEYFRDMIRVCHYGGYVVFDFYPESAIDNHAIEMWLASHRYYPVILPRVAVIDYFSKHNFVLIHEFSTKHGHSFSHYVIFRKQGEANR
ncbi:hypothetical protein U27_02123 [Candidatus Vecturithrix granuli]|uniref:Methyltransferase domain-containing protein n=1 Tax=Vecturithrix granuli TaxID=1499967 RepID=A0A0S6W9X3_VECG1|nr:hypothetical protein U27_02123 [Candidatus Vecturithrix granuli]